jgi:hypothetical protein
LRAASVAVSVSGGPPVPLIRDGSWVLWGAIKSLVRLSTKPGVDVPLARLGVVIPLGRFTSDSRPLGVTLAKGIASDSFPISSARSVMARLDEPMTSCRPLTSHAVTATITKKPITMNN